MALHDRFDDGYCGRPTTPAPGARRAQTRTGERDFWAISSELPTETRNYVPKLLADATLAQRPEHYGFRPPSPDEVIETRLMPIERPLSLEKIAQVCGIDGATLWQLNPTLKQGITPPKHLYGKAFNLRLPKATPETCADELAKLLLKTTASFRPIGSGEATPCQGLQALGR